MWNFISLSSMKEHMLHRAQQSGGSKTFQTSNAETSTQHGSFEQEQSRACRQEDGAGGEIAVNVLDPQRWRCHCILAPKPKAMLGARTIHTTHRQRKKWDKVALHRGGNWVGGQRRRRVLSKSDKVSMYSSYKLGRSGAVQIFTFFCVQNPRLQCLVFKWASLPHWQILWPIVLCIWLFNSWYSTHKRLLYSLRQSVCVNMRSWLRCQNDKQDPIGPTVSY